MRPVVTGLNPLRPSLLLIRVHLRLLEPLSVGQLLGTQRVPESGSPLRLERGSGGLSSAVVRP